jgi:uncharacterized protein (TIGR02246 family)
MRWKKPFCRAWMFSLFLCPGLLLAQGAKDESKDETAIRANVQSYLAAFNKRDAKALAAHWSPEAVYISRSSGEEIVGREALEKEFTAQFAEEKPAKLEVKVESIRFVSPNVAVEQGTARVIRPGQSPSDMTYSAVHVKRDGKWLLDRVTEEDIPVVVSHYDRLKELEWLIGDWVDEDEEATVEMSCKWARNKNFIIRSFSVSVRDRLDMAGIQVIGWDAAAKQVRSWVFDSDGGFADGVWTRKGKRWTIRNTGVLPDGRKASMTNVMTQVNENSFKWRTISREVGGEILPNVDEVLVVRKEAAK